MRSHIKIQNIFLQVWLLVLFISINLSISRCKPSQQKAKSVTTLIEAKWPATPYLFETCEYLAEEAPELMWSFIEEINKIQPDVTNKSTHTYYNIIYIKKKRKKKSIIP